MTKYIYNCKKCEAYEKSLRPTGFKLIKALIVALWRWFVSAAKPAPKSRTISWPVPRFYCGTCEKFLSQEKWEVIPHAITDLFQEFTIRCHGEDMNYKQTLVASMVTIQCHNTVFQPRLPRKVRQFCVDYVHYVDSVNHYVEGN